MKKLIACMLLFITFLLVFLPNISSTKNSSKTTLNLPSQSSASNLEDETPLGHSISKEVKNYIINGQESIPEAQKIKWSKAFLNQVDIEGIYKQYLSNGGTANDLKSFVSYMTLNSPIPSNWKDLFEKDLYDVYAEKVVKLEHLKGDLYQAYIIKDGATIPYVVVSSRTGYFHG